MKKTSRRAVAPKIRPVCFVVMPYGERKTGVDDPRAPERVNFNALYEKAFVPAIEAQGYTAVRADQETSPLIVVDMLESLTLADLVLADLTIHNGNVYYEIGVRHATAQHNCVLVAAEWARPLFDLQQIRQGRFPLPPGKLTVKDYARVQTSVSKAIDLYGDAASPVHHVHRTAKSDPSVGTFRELMERLSDFQRELREVVLLPTAARRRTRVARLVDRHAKTGAKGPMVRSVALELLFAVRDHMGWTETIDYVKRLPKSLRDLPNVREQLQLAKSKSGDHHQSIAALEALVKQHGETSERRGLIGGRYKKLYRESLAGKGRPNRRHLALAIENFHRGMLLDLNDYYPAGNLPRLHRTRSTPADEKRAVAALQVAILGCERALHRNPRDVWAVLGRLGTAFDVPDVEKAKELVDLAQSIDIAPWQIQTTLEDLEMSAALCADATLRSKLEAIVDALRALIETSKN